MNDSICGGIQEIPKRIEDSTASSLFAPSLECKLRAVNDRVPA